MDSSEDELKIWSNPSNLSQAEVIDCVYEDSIPFHSFRYYCRPKSLLQDRGIIPPGHDWRDDVQEFSKWVGELKIEIASLKEERKNCTCQARLGDSSRIDGSSMNPSLQALRERVFSPTRVPDATQLGQAQSQTPQKTTPAKVPRLAHLQPRVEDGSDDEYS